MQLMVAEVGTMRSLGTMNDLRSVGVENGGLMKSDLERAVVHVLRDSAREKHEWGGAKLSRVPCCRR